MCMFGNNDGKGHREDEHAEDDAEGEGGGDFDVPDDLEQHLDAHEAEDDAQAVFQIGEILGDGGKGEVEGAQAEDGEDVRREHDERIARHGENGRDGVDGKGDIGGLDDQQGDEEGCGQSTALLDDEESVFVHLVGDGGEALEELDEDVLRGVDALVVLMAEHLDARVDEEAKEEASPEFCMPTSMLSATHLGFCRCSRRPTMKPIVSPSRLCTTTTATTSKPAVSSRSALCDTTMPTANAITTDENAGR